MVLKLIAMKVGKVKWNYTDCAVIIVKSKTRSKEGRCLILIEWLITFVKDKLDSGAFALTMALKGIGKSHNDLR